ncbi:MAG TPA: rubredoxin [Bacilli bacterium]|nr:rubredoxin [Bacilli bacterium]
MAKYICAICGFVYDEEKGLPEAGIKPNTKWKNLPSDWVCPICGAVKSDFQKADDLPSNDVNTLAPVVEHLDSMKEMSPLQISALCTNLARGCEKQYKSQEASLFKELAEYYRNISAHENNPDVSQLVELIKKDLEEGYANANAVANKVKDRGALRALVWSEKVTRILNSLLTRYKKEGEAMTDNTGVYVCTICGFIYVGDKLPDVCPVCKVPNFKFEKIEGGHKHA